MNQGEDIFCVFRERRSVRRFRSDPLDPSILYRLVEAAGWAPSASNRQDWEFVVVTSQRLKEQMVEKVRQRWLSLLEKTQSGVSDVLKEYVRAFLWFSGAPVVVVVTVREPEQYLQHLLGDMAGSVAGSRLSAAMAAQNLMLAAHVLGIGSCCLTGPVGAQEDLKALLAVGRRREIVCLVALGYPEERPEPPPRRSVEEIVRFVE